MAYQIIEDFAAGIDLRRSAITAKPGTLRELSNGVVTGGGEIEKRQRFTSLGFVGTDTTGLSYDGVEVCVFGTKPAPTTAPPAPIGYRRLVGEPGETLSYVRTSGVFGGKFLVAARVNGTGPPSRLFYDGAMVGPTGINAARVHRGKVYAVAKTDLTFSALDSASDWAGIGSGIIDVSQQDSDTGRLMGMAEYYGQLACSPGLACRFGPWTRRPGAEHRVQTLNGVGLFAHNAAARFSTGDVLFLSDTGIRSLRAREQLERCNPVGHWLAGGPHRGGPHPQLSA